MTNTINTEVALSFNETNDFGRVSTSNIRALGAGVCVAFFLSYALSSGVVVTPKKCAVSIGQYSISTNSAPSMVYDNGSITVFSTDLDGAATMNWALNKNYQVLDEIASLKRDWNGNGANAFSEALVSKCRKILNGLRVQPDIFPTAQDSIQFEWNRTQGDYLEIELFEDGSCQLYLQRVDGSWKLDEIDSAEIGEKLDGFVAGSL